MRKINISICILHDLSSCVRFIYYRDIILFYHDCHLIIMCQMYSTRYKNCFAERVQGLVNIAISFAINTYASQLLKISMIVQFVFQYNINNAFVLFTSIIYKHVKKTYIYIYVTKLNDVVSMIFTSMTEICYNFLQ